LILGRPIKASLRKQYLFIASILVPIVSIFLIMRVFPMLQTIFMSFLNYELVKKVRPFVGLKHYIKLFTQDRQFEKAITSTLLFTLITVPANLIMGLGLALLLQSRTRRSAFLESLFFIPYIAPLVPMAIVWQWLYTPQGVLNDFLKMMGLSPVGWMNADMAIFSIMIMFVWQMNGYIMIIFLVGLRGIPDIYYDAAKIDGANWWHQFSKVTMPLLTPITLYGVVMASLWAFLVFSQVYVMTQGSDVAPGGDIRVLVIDIYEKGFRYYKMGYASAEAVILLFIILAITLIQLKLIRRQF
ncbi:MAG TPA: sugar ABC transporter permease, partial [Spirochaetia bacterium]|nr:sugar ABC transporter permease [Spirochaetia bacterium]